MGKLNCWEVMKCGRGPGGGKVEELGIYPVALPNEYDDINKGYHGGRFCWVIAGTFCLSETKPDGIFAQKLDSCIECKFFKQVQEEEGKDFVFTPGDAKKLQDK